MIDSMSVVIPTFNRGSVLLKTVDQLLRQTEHPHEIILVDQTKYNDNDEVAQHLAKLHDEGSVRWVKRSQPSIPKAMNHGLKIANSKWVLFLDDDIEIDRDFIENHFNTLSTIELSAYVGQIVQPWQRENQPVENYAEGKGLKRDLAFPFNSDKVKRIYNCMAGNLCVNRLMAISAGGFDENFTECAYRFETEFCRRYCRYHDTAFGYVPLPKLHHLHFGSGGTRAHANLLTSSSAAHSMGEYYFALLEGKGGQRVTYIVHRILRSLIARYYVTRPWYIPVRFLAELRGLASAYKSYRAGQSLINE